MKTQNITRAFRAQKSLKAYNGIDDPATNLRDLLADLLHLAEHMKLDPDQEITMAQIHYRAER